MNWNEIEIFCQLCGEFRPVTEPKLKTDELNGDREWADVCCAVCKLVLITIQRKSEVKAEGVYQIRFTLVQGFFTRSAIVQKPASEQPTHDNVTRWAREALKVESLEGVEAKLVTMGDPAFVGIPGSEAFS